MIKYIAMNEHINLEDCVLIEDTLSTMVAAKNAGITALHITHIIYAGLESEQKYFLSNYINK